MTAATGWMCLAIVVGGAVVARLARRRRRRGLRVHEILGACALCCGVAHAGAAGSAAATSDPTGIQVGAAGLAGIAFQGFLGLALRDPGDYRRPLRRWHVALFLAIVVASAWHVLASAPYGAALMNLSPTAGAPDPR